jgi:hypothetical protein
VLKKKTPKSNVIADDPPERPLRVARRARDYWTAASTLATCVATALAAWAAWEARLSVSETSRATRATIWMQMLAEYASPEMLAAMKDLRQWQKMHPQFASDFKALLLNADKSSSDAELANKLDLARRRAGQFFNKLRVLCDIRVMEEQDIGLTWSTGTYSFVANVLEPMETAKTEALFAEGSITASDTDKAKQIHEQNLVFYRRVFERHR